MYPYKIEFSYLPTKTARICTEEEFFAESCQDAANRAYANKAHLRDLRIERIWKGTATGSWMAVNAWTQPTRPVTAFEQLCSNLGVDLDSEAAEVVSTLVNALIFSDGDYTDDEIVAIVTDGFRKWENRSKPCESNQGFEIIATESYSATYRIVLGYKTTSLGPAYVTWESSAGADGTYDYFWGHYFSNEREARADYHRRLLRHYE